MKKYFIKIKAILTILWVTLISFSSKVIGQFEDTIDGWNIQDKRYNPNVQWIYWVPSPEPKIGLAVNIAQILLIAVTFIVWIVSFIKIRKIDDRAVKKKKIRNAVIIISILVILIIALLFSTPLLTEYFS